MRIAQRARTIARWPIIPACAGSRIEVTAMLKRVNGKPVPNNPAKAYELGRLDGTKQCMDNVKMADIEKALRGEYKLLNSAE